MVFTLVHQITSILRRIDGVCFGWYGCCVCGTCHERHGHVGEGRVGKGVVDARVAKDGDEACEATPDHKTECMLHPYVGVGLVLVVAQMVGEQLA